METRTRYPHIQGTAALAYTESGEYLLTTGADNLVRRVVVDSQDSQDMLDLDFRGLSIATKARRFAVAGDSGVCELYDVDSLKRLATLARTVLPLRGVSFSADQNWCGIVGDDFCRIVDTNDTTNYVSVDVPNVKHLSFHPTQPLVVCVSSLDGVVRILDLAQPEPGTQKLGEIEMVVPRITDMSDEKSTCGVWAPQGECLALPNKVFSIALINTKDWLPAKQLEGHNNAIVHMSFSPNGRYLASCGRDDCVIVWDLMAKTVLKRIPVEHGLEVAWHPHENQLSCITFERRLHTFSEVVDPHLPAPTGGEIFNPLEHSPVSKLATERLDDMEALFVSDEDEEAPREDVRPRPPSDRSSKRSLDHFQPGNKRARLGNLSSLQAAFQSGQTPWIDQRRLLCISPVGYVWSVRHSAEHYSVTITFFDQSERREVHFQDTDLFDLAAVTAQACILANSRTGKLAVRFHSSLMDNWTLDLDLKVDGGISCVALSSEVAVVFTKSGYMRAFTLYGTPLAVYRKGGSSGSVVTCAAFNNEVFAVYQQAPNSYTYSLEDVALGTLHQCRDGLEIGQQATLTSAFFSESGEPYIMDSEGVLSTLVKARQPGQARWVPVFSSQAGVNERKYWPISVLDSKLLCVILRGQQQFPSIPLGLVEEVDLQVPGLPKLEAEYLVQRCQFQQLQDRAEYAMRLAGSEEVEEDVRDVLADMSVDLDKLLLRQFQAACSEKRASRGLQIIALVQRPDSLVAAAKIAGAYELTTLASRIAEIMN